MSYFWLAVGWVLYFTLHSVMATESIKQLAARTLGLTLRFYRLIYSLFSIAGLVFLLLLNGSIVSPYFFESKGWVRYLSLMFTTFGVMTIQIAFRQYRLKSFLGFAEESLEFKTEGLLKIIRHPIYAGIILVTIGFFLFIPNIPTLITCVSLLGYLPIGIYLEEKKLLGIYGELYRNYKMKVPALIPRLTNK